MLNKYFASYAEYTLRMKLSEPELRTALQRECGLTFANCKSCCLAAWHKKDKVPFFMRKNRAEIVLIPGCRGRNSARGEVHLNMEKDSYSTDTILHIVIRPRNMCWFCVLWLGFTALWTIGVLCARKWLMLIPVPVMLGGFFLILSVCRSCAEQEIPQIQRSLEALLRKLEKERPEKLSAKENRKQKKIIGWITYVLNMLVALPVFGLISVTIFSLTYQIICNTDPPMWAWSSPILLTLFLIVFWGRYQYRILILKTPRPPHETRRNLLILAGFITIVFLLIFCLATYNKIERMEKTQQKLEQMKKMQQENP